MKLCKNDYIKNNDFEGALERFNIANKRWKKHWWEAVETIYTNVKELSKKYILDSQNMIVKIKTIINYLTSFTETKGAEKVYLFKFYDYENRLLFSKVGTTKRTIKERLNEEITSYKKRFEIGLAEIVSVINCGEIPAEGAESIVRAVFIKKCPKSFIKNDRFLATDINVDVFNKIVYNYLGGGDPALVLPGRSLKK